MKTQIKIIASEQAWIEGEAVRQLEKTAELPGMQIAVGLPDLHPGKGHPIGAVFACKGIIYPYLIGNDIGCGMGLWQTGLKKKKLKPGCLADKLTGLEEKFQGEIQGIIEEYQIEPSPADPFLGTIGGGNHFAELQIVDRMEDEVAFSKLGLEKNYPVLLVHSGSRGLGEAILRTHVDAFKAAGLNDTSVEAKKYLTAHDHAIQWAQGNRATIALRFFELLRTEGRPILDVPHNIIAAREINNEKMWLHRKGAAPADCGPLVIPGSRGAFSYLVQPIGSAESALYSVAHGAGRKWNRSSSRQRLRQKFSPDDLRRTEFGSRVICEDKDLLYEEAPQAYKNIDTVVEDLCAAGLIKIIAVYKPIVTYKKRSRKRKC